MLMATLSLPYTLNESACPPHWKSGRLTAELQACFQLLAGGLSYPPSMSSIQWDQSTRAKRTLLPYYTMHTGTWDSSVVSPSDFALWEVY